MRPLLPVHSFRVHRLTLVVVLFTSLGTASAADPVEDLARFLRERPNFQDEDQMTSFQKNLTKRLMAIQRPSDLRRALMQTELSLANQRDKPTYKENPFEKIYQGVRADLVKRLQKVLREHLRAKDSTRRLTAIAFLASMAREELERDPQGFMGLNERHTPLWPTRFTLSMANDLQNLLANKDEEPRVRAAAVAAVAAIDPGGEKTLNALQALLKPEREVVERRAAATALRLMIQNLLMFQNLQMFQGLSAPREQKQILTLTRIVAVAGLGLTDKQDADVRRLCLESIRQALHNPTPYAEDLRPLVLRAANEQTPAVIALLNDGDFAVCLAAHQVLEEMVSARRRLRGTAPFPRDAIQGLWAGVPLGTTAPFPRDAMPPTEKRPAQDAKLLDGILKALPALKTSLANEKEVRIRLAALYVLETLDDAAADAIDNLVIVLKDKNGFVRWGAARVLHNMAPLQAKKAVPALAEALTDANKTVRLTAAQALGRYGAQAKDAVKGLSTAIGDEEAQVRIGALNALKAIGVAAHPASGAVVQALGDQKPEVRAGAAQALARMGPLDDKAKKELLKALEDADPTVRRAASETLLDN